MRRADFVKLVDYDLPKLKARAGRDLLPFIDADPEGGWTHYRPVDAYLTLIVDELNERLGLPLDRACSLTVALSDYIIPALPRIAVSATAILRGEPIAEFCGGGIQIVRTMRTTRGGRVVETWLPLLGTADAVGAAIANHEPVAAVALVNLTRIAALLRQRAEKHRIDLGGLFAEEARP